MFRISYTNKALIQLDTFINSYKKNFIQLYYDSGVYGRDIIIGNYVQLGDDFYRDIMSYIKRYIGEDIVLGRKKGENSYSLMFHQRSFLIIIDYTEDITTQTRYIENIEITKKT